VLVNQSLQWASEETPINSRVALVMMALKLYLKNQKENLISMILKRSMKLNYKELNNSKNFKSNNN